jgi:hypothetical protein
MKSDSIAKFKQERVLDTSQTMTSTWISCLTLKSQPKVSSASLKNEIITIDYSSIIYYDGNNNALVIVHHSIGHSTPSTMCSRA